MYILRITMRPVENRRPFPRRLLWLLTALVPALVILSACQTVVSEEQHAREYPAYAAMTEELQPVEFFSSTDISVIRDYYERCTKGIPDARHEAGYFYFKGNRIAVHLFYPAGVSRTADVSGAVVVLHGYLSHALDQAAVIHRALEANFVVVVPELPGHGLSGGVRGAIEDFSDYGRFVGRLVDLMDGELPRPWHVIGHSTGAFSVIQYLWMGDDPFDRVVLSAPLVRSYLYNFARFGRVLTRPFMDSVRTQYDSPLGVSRMPLAWFDAQVRWNQSFPQRLATQGPVERPLLVIQGNKDRVVAWRYNRRVLRELFPHSRYHVIQGASHVLYQERPALRREALDITFDYIESGTAEGAR